MSKHKSTSIFKQTEREWGKEGRGLEKEIGNEKKNAVVVDSTTALHSAYLAECIDLKGGKQCIYIYIDRERERERESERE